MLVVAVPALLGRLAAVVGIAAEIALHPPAVGCGDDIIRVALDGVEHPVDLMQPFMQFDLAVACAGSEVVGPEDDMSIAGALGSEVAAIGSAGERGGN